MGRRIVVLSGGTAFRSCARRMAELGMDAVHLLPGFDSGGSSAMLRAAFGMPAVGDLRSRLLAMAPRTAAASLLGRRLPPDGDEAAREFDALRAGRGGLLGRRLAPSFVRGVRARMAEIGRRLPRGTDLSGASVGNLVLAAMYLGSSRDMAAAARAFARLVGSRGEAFLSSDASAHLCVRLEDGGVLVGQRAMTGKECPAIASRIVDVRLCRSESDASPVSVAAGRAALSAIGRADLVVLPVGSFYSSVASHLLLDGVPEALRANPCPKLFIPNAMPDPELIGCPLEEQTAFLSRFGAVTHLLTDPSSSYPGGVPSEAACRALGLTPMRRAVNARDGRLMAGPAVEAMAELAGAVPPGAKEGGKRMHRKKGRGRMS